VTVGEAGEGERECESWCWRVIISSSCWSVDVSAGRTRCQSRSPPPGESLGHTL